MARLGDVCKIQYGFPFDSASFSDSKGTPLIRIRDVLRGYSETYTTEECSEEYVVHNGDMLIGMDGEFNIARWHGGKAFLNQRVCRLIPNDLVNAGYLFYFMPTALKAIEDKTPFVTVKHLSAKELNKIVVPLPPLENQLHIAAMLDKVSDLIRLRKQQLAKLDELIKARFVEMFGDPISNSDRLPTLKLGEVCDLQAGDFTSADAIHELCDENNPYPCYGGNGIRGYVNNFTQEGEFPLIGRQGALCGNVQLATGKFRNTEHAVLVTPKVELNRIWLFELLRLEDLYRFHTGAAQPGLTVKTLNMIDIPIAEIQAQNAYAEFYSQINKSKSAVQKSLNETQLLFDSLMQRYFG